VSAPSARRAFAAAVGPDEERRLPRARQVESRSLFPVGEALTNLTRPAFPTTGIGPITVGDED